MALLKHKYSHLEWALFGVIFFSCSPWPFWIKPTIGAILLYTCVGISFLFFLYSKRLRNTAGIGIFLLLFFYFFLFQVRFDNQAISYSSVLIALSFLLAKSITLNEGKNVVILVTNYIFLSIIIPLPLWLIHQFVIPIPEIGTIDVSLWKGGLPGSTTYLNHFFFITVDGLEAMRFYSWYDEPGVLGTLASFVLWANRYNMHDFKVFVIMLGSIFTFSMAFFVLSFVGIIMQYCMSIKKLVVVGCVFVIVGIGVYSLLEDNLAFQQSVVYRIENPEDTDVESRANDDTNKYWKNINKSFDKQLLGLGNGTIAIAASYKNFIICYGYLGLTLILIAYIALAGKINKYAIQTLFLLVLSFMQRPNLFTAYNFILYTIIIRNYMFTKQKNRNYELIKHSDPILRKTSQL